MAGSEQELTGPDFSGGVPVEQVPAGGAPLVGHLDGEQVLVFRRDDGFHAVGATCTHYGGPLWDGLVEGDTVRCPWHHACFSLRTGEALAAPALNPLPTWSVVERAGRLHLERRELAEPLSARGRRAEGPRSVVIVGAGAAGSAAAELLRREGYAGSIHMIDPEPDAPYDRPNLSKDYLAGSAPEEWIPLRPAGFHAGHGIERIVDRVERIDRGAARVRLASGSELEYGALLLATGASPRALDIAGADAAHVHLLRSLDDCRRIIRGLESARSAAVVGAGFIGMEVAAALRARGLAVTVVSPEAVPMERVFGAELGQRIRATHEAHGVVFRLGRTPRSIDADHVVLDDASMVKADLVVIGIGVVPDTALAEAAGLEVDRGIVVDAFLRTSDARIYAAGDNARWPDARTGERVRVEHWVVAQRQGQAAARNILGANRRFTDVPFFWTRHFELGVDYVGHAEAWDAIDVTEANDEAAYRYVRNGRLDALATIGLSELSLETERALAAEAGTNSQAGHA